MGKTSRPRQLGAKEAVAVLTGYRCSPQKLNLLAALIRGKSVARALNDLAFSKKRTSGDIKKLLESAIANAEYNHSLDVDLLYVKEASVGKGIVLRRFHARARGRGAKILKPFSQMRIVVAEKVAVAVEAKVESKGDAA